MIADNTSLSHFLVGFIGGLAIAAPVGPIGMLCIKRSVSEGRIVGLMCGLGAATADMVYGTVAGLGLSTISEILLVERVWIQLFGGAALAVIGVATFRARPGTPESHVGARKKLGSAYASTLVLTLMNPMTILSFLAIFAGLGLGGAVAHSARALLLIVGIFLGSMTWWLVVSLSGAWLGSRLEHGGLRVVDWVAGTIIFGLGAWQLAEAVQTLAHRI